MKLPKGCFFRPRQKALIAKDAPAIIRIETRAPHPYANLQYGINNRNFDSHIAPYLRGDWEEFDRLYTLRKDFGFEGDLGSARVVYSGAEHPSPRADEGLFKLPNITVVPNLETGGIKGPHSSEGDCYVFGCTMGHYHPLGPSGWRIQEVYEFQSYGLMLLDHEGGKVEMWVAQDGDKIAVPSGCHMTLYNLGDHDHPLITLDFANPDSNPSTKRLVEKCGPILLAYYDEVEVVFTLNLLYINHPFHEAGVRLSWLPTPTRARQVRIPRGARQDLGKLLYEQLTQNPTVIAQFSSLGIQIYPASLETVLEPLPSDQEGRRLYFTRPLAACMDSQEPRTAVYRYFFPETGEDRPESPQSWRRPPYLATSPSPSVPLNRPLVVVVEGAGDWVDQAYRNHFTKLGGDGRLAVFYADDTRWKSRRPQWAGDSQTSNTMQSWEVYLDKEDEGHFLRYRLLRPDVVFVVTPDFTHSAIAKYWLGKTPTVFMEKPFDSEIKNVEALQIGLSHERTTEVRGLDHYKHYASPLVDMKQEIDDLLGVALARVEFYLTEDRAIEPERTRTLQYGLTLDLLPHLIALLTFFGDINSIDELVVLEASQYEPLDVPFRNETATRIRFTFQDYSGNGFRVPCTAVVGKGFSQEIKYLEVTGRSSHAVRIDFRKHPDSDPAPGYPWNSIFFLRGTGDLPGSLPVDTKVIEIADPYLLSRTLHILHSVSDDSRLCRKVVRSRYQPLFEDLVNGVDRATTNTLELSQGRDTVRALDRIWWAIQDSRPWQKYSLLARSPMEPCKPRSGESNTGQFRRSRFRQSDNLDEAVEYTDYIARTRGLFEVVSLAFGHEHTIYDLIKALRRQAGSLPVTVIVQGWGTSSAKEFLDLLANALTSRNDAIWLIPQKEDGHVPATPDRERTVVLDLDEDTDLRIYSNLVPDLIFFPSASDEEIERVRHFQGRAHALLIDNRSPRWKTIGDTAYQAELTFFLWSGDNKVAVPRASDEERPAEPVQAKPSAGETQPDLDELGGELRELAAELANTVTRRQRFRFSLRDLMARYPSHLRWHEDLARLADEHHWPAWAVQCLPELFIPLPAPSARQKAAVVWKYLGDCLNDPRSHEVGTLCDGELRKVIISPEDAEFLTEISRTIAKSLNSNPYWGDGAFNSIIADAFEDIRTNLRSHDPEAANRIREVERRFLADTGIIGVTRTRR